jgi:hypothetical protein
VSTYDISFFAAGKPVASEVVLRHAVVRAFTISTTATDHKAYSGVAASASSVYNIQKNGSTFITVTFAASGSTGTVAVTNSSLCTVSIGDSITAVAPATQDTLLSDVYMTLKGSF